VGAIPAFVVT